MFRILCLVIGYFIGCIQSAFVVGKVMRVDIRKHGSGNLGTTNALRVLGKRAGAVTFACDILKSVISFTICYKLFGGAVAGVYASFGAVLGHDFPFYLKFKGGKGIAATVGMVGALSVVINPWMALATYAIGILGVLFSGTVSLGSLLFSVSIPVALFFMKAEQEIILVSIIMMVLAFYRHKENIVRLKNGTENRLFGKKKNN
ncbi:MAG: glycerol-3-phosphate 1-O-acyltransferase PlsY [Lachnospiraceae bacterium]|nr:glycerol-3-phosphate 1-O-acyltransferase PlsY [Lachnospiraceae bacterium]